MSEYFYHPLAPPQAAAYDLNQIFDDYAAPQKQQQPQQQIPFDFDFQPFIASHDAYNSHIPSVEAFDNDLDSSLAAWDVGAELQLVNTDNSDLFRRIRTETPTRGGPSTIHSESASGYDTGYADSAYDPAYGSAYGSAYNPSEASALSAELDMNLQALGITARDDHYGSSPVSPNPNIGMNRPNYSPPTYHRGSFSDYEPQTHMRAPASSASDYYPHSPLTGMGVKYSSSVVQATVSPANVSAQLPSMQSTPSPIVSSQRALKSEVVKESIKDPKRKYQCPSCPRGQ